MIEAVSYLALAVWLVHLGRRLQLEQDAEDRVTEAAPPRLTLVSPPPGISTPNEGKPSEAGGIRIPLERIL